MRRQDQAVDPQAPPGANCATASSTSRSSPPSSKRREIVPGVPDPVAARQHRQGRPGAAGQVEPAARHLLGQSACRRPAARTRAGGRRHRSPRPPPGPHSSAGTDRAASRRAPAAPACRRRKLRPRSMLACMRHHAGANRFSFAAMRAWRAAAGRRRRRPGRAAAPARQRSANRRMLTSASSCGRSPNEYSVTRCSSPVSCCNSADLAAGSPRACRRSGSMT